MSFLIMYEINILKHCSILLYNLKINFVKRKIQNAHKNNKCRLSGDRDKICNPIINECSKYDTKGI